MRARVGQASWPVFPGIDRWRVCHIATHGRKPIDGNPSLTVWALIGAPSVSERVTALRFFMKFRGRNAHPNRVEGQQPN
jgi:hypothetical protein